MKARVGRVPRLRASHGTATTVAESSGGRAHVVRRFGDRVHLEQHRSVVSMARYLGFCLELVCLDYGVTNRLRAKQSPWAQLSERQATSPRRRKPGLMPR
jgi:hypothetical protein